VHAGIDVAEAGEDETVLVIREGTNLLKLKSWRSPDPRGEVLAELAPYRGRFEYVNIASIGVGAYFAEHIRDHGYPVNKINVSQKPRDSEKYSNSKAELYWGLRMRFEAGEVAGLADERAISQLATIRYSDNARGQLEIESKGDARKRGVKSPDRAEAIMLAYAAWQGSGNYELMRQQHAEKIAAEEAGARPSGWSGLVAQRGNRPR
jgi:phage terminase large subunit